MLAVNHPRLSRNSLPVAVGNPRVCMLPVNHPRKLKALKRVNKLMLTLRALVIFDFDKNNCINFSQRIRANELTIFEVIFRGDVIYSNESNFCLRLLMKCCRTLCSITKTRPCNIQQYFMAVKMFIFR